ncbi:MULTISPECIES: helix-turn-helix domain-containing protein [unclassified Ruegeria]|uniref:helix-turn-helix domain-containing protein n=1 Tax=unclassified Ruegeria TaxID=2625375 RepID=UPI00147C575F|nr:MULTISPECIES: helix-turn-helix domain-containing protein [unclassified Ruegeria]
MKTLPFMQHSTYETTDFEDLQEAASAWDQEYTQLSPGQFFGSMELTEVGTTQVMREKWGRKMRYRGVGIPGGYGFALPLGSTNSVNWLGSSVEQTSVVMQSPYLEAQLVSDDTWDSLVLSFPMEEVQAILIALSGGIDLSHRLHGNLVLNQAKADRIKRGGLSLLQKTKSCSPKDHAVYAAQVDQFKKQFLWTLLESFNEFLVPSPPSKQGIIVQKATDLALADFPEVLGLIDICTNLGISLRSLHYAFQDVAGISPATWLRRVRLNQVYRVLKNSDPMETKIKRVAAEHGFLHLGHFSNQYKQLFGHLPSHTHRVN